jgi:thiamine pyrophosphokinase
MFHSKADEVTIDLSLLRAS